MTLHIALGSPSAPTESSALINVDSTQLDANGLGALPRRVCCGACRSSNVGLTLRRGLLDACDVCGEHIETNIKTIF
jgi:hypothetical protein